MITIETPRLLLREFILSDAENFFELNNDYDVIRYTGDKAFSTIEEAQQLISSYMQYEKYRMGRLTMILKSSNEILGWCGLKFLEETNEVDLGYRLHKKYWGKGYATEAGIACIDFGFTELKLNRIIGRAAKENVGSIRVLEKCGMKFLEEKDCGHDAGVVYEIMNTFNV